MALRTELTDEHARQLLVDAIRNHMASPGAIFSPYAGLDLTYHEGRLHRVHGTHREPLAPQHEILLMDDDEIHELIEGKEAVAHIATLREERTAREKAQREEAERAAEAQREEVKLLAERTAEAEVQKQQAKKADKQEKETVE